MYYTKASLARHLDNGVEPLEKEGRIYVAPFTEGPLRVASPPLTVVESNETGLWFTPPSAFATFLKASEDALLQVALANAKAWRLEDDDRVRRAFKTFFRAEDGAFKVRADAQCGLFDERGEAIDPEDPDARTLASLAAGTTVRVLLEMDKVCVGREELGGLWRVVQLQFVPSPPACTIEEAAAPSNETAEPGAGADDGPPNPDFA